ncbi:MAG: hypothetical protein PHH77_02310 [Victivallaceae bacterium]|nr:hypothetical protein [Victivallaceae bacterium]MDD5697425.1 hypothetical protein [Victivallaceae bacterium]
MKRFLVLIFLFVFEFGVFAGGWVEVQSGHFDSAVSYYVPFTLVDGATYRLVFTNYIGPGSIETCLYSLSQGRKISDFALSGSHYYYGNFSMEGVWTAPGDSDLVFCLVGGLWGAVSGDYVLSRYQDIVPQPPVITSSISLSKTAGSSFSYVITATGTDPITYSASGLPSYLSFDGGSIVSGTLPSASTAYSFTFTVQATNDYGSDSKVVTVNVSANQLAPTITSAGTCNAVAGSVSHYTVTATGTDPITYSASNLPSWASFSGSQVTFSSPPYNLVGTTVGITVQATNDYGSDSKNVTVSIVAPSGQLMTNDGSFDSDDDVPAINELKQSVIDNFTSLITFLDEKFTYWGLDIHTSLQDIYNFLLDMGQAVVAENLIPINNNVATIKDTVLNVDANVSLINDNIAGLKDAVINIDTNVSSIDSNLSSVNDTFFRVEDLLILINNSQANQEQHLVDIKTALDSQLTVQQNILDVLNQIANSSSEEIPTLPESVDNPAAPEYSFTLTPEGELQTREMKTYEKDFPEISQALRQRDGTLPYTFVVPLSKVSDRLEDRVINFSEGVVGDMVSAFRTVIAACLYYFTLLQWFRAVRRIAD